VTFTISTTFALFVGEELNPKDWPARETSADGADGLAPGIQSAEVRRSHERVTTFYARERRHRVAGIRCGSGLVLYDIACGPT
jgi:hypothetical protein